MQPIARQLQQLDYNNGNGVFSMWSVLSSYLEDNWGDPVSCQLTESELEIHPLKRRLGGWCEMATSLGVVI
jgi:hypothetical protein